MRQLPSDPVYQPKHTSKFLIVGLVMVVFAVAALIARYSQFSVEAVLTRAMVSMFAAVSCGLGLILIAIGIARSWGIRAFQTVVLIVGALVLGTAGVFLVIDLRSVPKALASLMESHSSDDEPVAEDAAVLEAQKPIVTTPHTLRNEDEYEYFATWHERHWIQPFNRHSTGDAQQDEAIRALSRDWVAFNRRKFDAQTLPQMDERWKAILAKTPDDPFARMLTHRRDPGLDREDLEIAEKELARRGDAPVPLFLTRLQLWSHRYRAQAETSVPPEPVLEALKAAMAECPCDEIEAWAWNIAIEGSYHHGFVREHGEKIIEVMEPLTGKHPWLAHNIRGKSHLLRSYKARAAGSNAEYQNHLAIAQTELTEAWKLYPKNPAAASLMILVAMSKSDDPKHETREWFDRATSAVIDYKNAYDHYRMAISHGWHGSDEALAAFAGACRASNRFDTWVPWESIGCYQQMVPDSPAPEDVFSDADVWEDAEGLIEDYIARQGPKDSPGFWESQAAILAYKCGELENCKTYLEKIGYHLNGKAADDWGVDAETWVARAAADVIPDFEPLESANEAESGGTFADAASSLAKAAETPGISDLARTHLDHRAADVRAMADLQQKPWQPMFAGGDLRGWRVAQGKPTTDAKGTVQANKDLILVCEQPVGTVFELRGEMELTGKSFVICGGVGFGQPDCIRDDWVGVQLMQYSRGRMKLNYDVRGMSDADLRLPTEASHTAKIHVQVIGERLLVHVNGELALDQRIEEPSARNASSRLALYALNSDENATVRWCSFEWRKQ